ncbi:MAG: hypothetical protein AAFW89_08010 [Bacteroidota bacterium]
MRKCLKINLFLVACFLLSLSTNLEARRQTGNTSSEDEIEVYLSFRYRSVVNTVLISYYKNDTFYLPIAEIFNLLEINQSIDAAGDLILSGNYYVDQQPYTINLTRQTATMGEKTVRLTSDDFSIKEFDYYFTTEFFESFLGLQFVVDFNNLTVLLQTQNPPPIMERLERSQRRKRLRRTSLFREEYDLEFDRERKVLSGLMLDYNLSTSVLNTGNNIFTYSSSMGAEFLGGDVQGTAFGSYTQNNSVFNTQGFRWRYVMDNLYLTSLTVGQEASNGILSLPYTGIKLSNNPIEPRVLYDEYRISGVAEPNSEVEVFFNRNLFDYQTTDETGRYNFLVPLTYGASVYDLRIFKRSGGVEENSQRILIPFNFIPKGEVNYNFNAGQLDFPTLGNTENDYFAQGDVSAGVNDWLTVRAGAEYYSEFHQDNIPTLSTTLSARVLDQYLVSVDASNDAFLRSSVNVVYPNAASINASFTRFLADDGIFNAGGNEEFYRLNVFYPLSIGGFPLNLRFAGNRQTQRNSVLNNYRFELNTRVDKLNLRLSYADANNEEQFFASTIRSRLISTATYNFSRGGSRAPGFLKGVFIRGQFQYLTSLSQLESFDFLISRNIFTQGLLQLSFGRNLIGDFNTMGFNLVFDFNKTRSNTNIRSFGSNVNYTQSFRGSVGLDPINQHLLLTSRAQVGRSGTAVKLFVDNNNSGHFDEGDETINSNAVRIDRTGMVNNSHEGLTYFTQMLPYFRYNIEVNKGAIRNPLLVPKLEKFALITDPNQFKQIEIPFYMSGVIEGEVVKGFNKTENPLAGAKIFVKQVNGEFETTLRTFSDGSYYAYEIPPGEYEAYMDTAQLGILSAKSVPEKLSFEVQALPEGDFIEGLNFLVIPEDSVLDLTPDLNRPEPVIVAELIEDIKSDNEIQSLEQDLNNKVDQSLRFIIQAQVAFYARNLEDALHYVEQSLSLFETAQGYALKGSLQYLNGDKVAAQNSWDKAVKFDPDIYIPGISVLNQIIASEPQE